MNNNSRTRIRRLLPVSIIAAYNGLPFATEALAQAASTPAPATQVAQSGPAATPAFAFVDDHPLSAAELHQAFSALMRRKYYHGQVPEGQIQQAMKEAQDQVIEGYLLTREAERRAVVPDQAKIDAEIAAYEARYKDSAQWQQAKDVMIPRVRGELERRSRRERLEQEVRSLPVPTVAEVRAYYESKKELFTEPERLRLRAIILAVDPSSGQVAWDAAHEEARKLAKRLRDGADFAEQARIFSNDASAEAGGDMGYLHRGMLPDPIQEKVDGFKIGEISEPLTLLQGIGIFRLDERVPAKLRDFDQVVERARDLLLRERQDAAWSRFVEQLKQGARIVMVSSAPQAAAGK